MRSLIAIALVAGCGFVPEDDFTGRRSGDGIAPWRDLGPVQICLGTEYIGPPSSLPGGMCGSTTVVPEPCLGDDDCRSRESCVCGSCTVQYCTANSDCGSGRACQFGENRCTVVCATDDECPDGQCVGGSCRGRCFVDDDCQTGEVCNADNFCITDPCNADGDCLAGERCRIQRIPRVATEPHLISRAHAGEPRLTMYVELSDPFLQDRRAIWRATSDDGVHFRIDPAQPVLDDGMMARAPSVIRTPAGFGMYYQLGSGAAIRYASSTDGVSFGAPTTVLDQGATPGVVAPSAVALPDGSVAVYYLLADGSSVQLATGQVGGPLSGAGAVLAVSDVEHPGSSSSTSFWIDITRLGSPHALLTTNLAVAPSLRLWFSAFGTESGDSYQFGQVVPIAPTFSIGYAAASVEAPSSLEPWPYNPIFDRVSAFIDHLHELAPAAVQISDPQGAPLDGYLLYHVDGIDQNMGTPPVDVVPNRIGVAGNGAYEAVTGR